MKFSKLSTLSTLVSITLMLTSCVTSKTYSLEKSEMWPVFKDVIPSVELESYIEENKFESESTCKKFDLVSSKSLTQLKKQVAYLEKVANGTPRNALKFITSTSWATEMSNEEQPEEASYADLDFLHSFVTEKLRGYMSADGKQFPEDLGGIEGSYGAQAAKFWLKNYCKLDFSNNKLWNSNVATFNSYLNSIESLSESVPWYPEGYSAWSGDSNLAWKWDQGHYCSLGDSCWHMKVVAQYSCSNLYAEINIMDSSGTVIDWTNDSVPYLSAGSSVRLEFRTYNDYAQTGRLVTLNCR